MTTTAKLSPTRVTGMMFIASLGLLTAIILAARVLVSTSPPKTIVYKGKTLEEWFYGSRKDFFMERTRKVAQEAVDGLGTNAFPFLVFTLKENRGNGAIYFKVYRALPAQVQAKLPYPISRDDLEVIALEHIEEMRKNPQEAAQTLAACVPGFENPRVRMRGFNLMLRNYQTDPAFLKLCRILLNDAHPGIQLQAAIYLAQSAIVSDPGDARLFPILLAALESSLQRNASLDLQFYSYEQQPPGSSGPLGFFPFLRSSLFLGESDEALRVELIRALGRLERYLTDEQKDRLKRAEENNPPPSVKSSFLLSFLESVPDVAAKLREPSTKEYKFDDIVKSSEKAAVLVLVY